MVLKDNRGNERVLCRNMSNVAALKKCRRSNTETELRVRRLRWMQRIVVDPGNLRQIIAGIFGRCRMEGTETIDSEGRLTSEANSYPVRWMQDTGAISEMQGASNYSETSVTSPCACLRSV